MKNTIVKVPGPMLLDRHLAGSAKLLWMILQLDARNHQAPISPGLLEARSGLARHTVLRGAGPAGVCGLAATTIHEARRHHRGGSGSAA